MWKRLMPVLAAALFIPGCIQKETTQTLYLEPDGSLTWSVLEHRIRSDAGTREERVEEEEAYIARVRREEHPVARAFRSLEPFSMETRLLRRDRPQTVLTTARFKDFAFVFQGLLDRAGIPGEAWMEPAGTGERLVVSIPLDEGGEIVQVGEGDEEADVTALLEGYQEWEILLARGRFLEAEGFEISEAGARASLLEIEDEGEDRAGDAEIRLVLAWTTDG